jgi:hypothetical protein
MVGVFSELKLDIDFTRPLPVPAGINPKVTELINYCQSGLLISPFRASKINPSPDIVIIASYYPILSSFFTISKACMAL